METIMNENDNILGCFVSGPALYHDSDQQTINTSKETGELFRNYIWGEYGFCNKLKSLKHEAYGKDLVLILFQFYLNPIPYELENLKEIERYRKKEKSIGIPVIVNDNNFFNRSENDRQEFLRKSILQKIDLLSTVVNRNKLDTKIELLKTDIEMLFTSGI
jgi:hypothetical protein